VGFCGGAEGVCGMVVLLFMIVLCLLVVGLVGRCSWCGCFRYAWRVL